MPLPKAPNYTTDDYWNLPDNERAELIDGQLYALAAPGIIHQRLSFALSRKRTHYQHQGRKYCHIKNNRSLDVEKGDMK